MIIILLIWALSAAWFFGDWKRFWDYHATMLFFALGNLVYRVLAEHHRLWDVQADFIFCEKLVEMLYILVVFPCVAFVFLSTFPSKINKQMIHVIKWVTLFTAIECIGNQYHKIIYDNGWNIYYSAVFNVILFLMLRLHKTKPLYAYPLSLAISLSLILLFHVDIRN